MSRRLCHAAGRMSFKLSTMTTGGGGDGVGTWMSTGM